MTTHITTNVAVTATVDDQVVTPFAARVLAALRIPACQGELSPAVHSKSA